MEVDSLEVDGLYHEKDKESNIWLQKHGEDEEEDRGRIERCLSAIYRKTPHVCLRRLELRPIYWRRGVQASQS